MKRLVFLGTPDVAARVLDGLARGCEQIGAQLVGVVAQPPARSSRHGGETPCPVHALALKLGLPVLTPVSARDPVFLETLRSLDPDLCVTAAYGQILPQSFLDIPRFGTINIHPSLLPQFRGAAPVQRAIAEGCSESGVTLCMTVLAMDAGPIVHQEIAAIGGDETAPEFLNRMFDLGTQRLLELLPDFFLGKIEKREQDGSRKSHAAKVSVEESWIDFGLAAATIHNRVRAFAGWPGTRARFLVAGESTEIKIVKTKIPSDGIQSPQPFSCLFQSGRLIIGCGDGSVLEILELQSPGKKAMAARDFWNGLRDKRMTVVRD